MSITRHQCARLRLIALLPLTMLALSLALCGCSLLPTTPTSALAPTARVPSVASATQATPLRAQPIGGFETITPDRLPPEARQTLWDELKKCDGSQQDSVADALVAAGFSPLTGKHLRDHFFPDEPPGYSLHSRTRTGSAAKDC